MKATVIILLQFLLSLAHADFMPFGNAVNCRAKISNSDGKTVIVQIESAEVPGWPHKSVTFNGKPESRVHGLGYFERLDENTAITLIAKKKKADGSLEIHELQFTMLDRQNNSRKMYRCNPTMAPVLPA